MEKTKDYFIMNNQSIKTITIIDLKIDYKSFIVDTREKHYTFLFIK